MARTMTGVVALALISLSSGVSLADDTQAFSIQKTEHWVQPTLDASGNIQRDANGKVVGGDRNWTWRATYDVNHTTDVIKINQTFELDTATGAGAITNAERDAWEGRMDGFWNLTASDWRIRCTDLTTGDNVDYKIAYDATLWREGEGPDSGLTAMYGVTVHDGAGSTSASQWYRGGTSASVNNAANYLVVEHETGHYLGLPDEYYEGWVDPSAGADVLKKAFTGDGIMNNTRKDTGGELYERYFYAWIQGLLAADARRGIDASTRSYQAVLIPAPAGSVVLALAGTVAFRRRRSA